MKLSKKKIQEFKILVLIVRKLYYGDELNEITKWVDEVANYPEIKINI